MVDSNYIKIFENSFKSNWELPAMTDYITKEEFSYEQVAQKIAHLHILFSELNIQRNDKIALVGKNTPMWGITFLAVQTYGAIIVPILQDFHPDDIQHIINSNITFMLRIDH